MNPPLFYSLHILKTIKSHYYSSLNNEVPTIAKTSQCLSTCTLHACHLIFEINFYVFVYDVTRVVIEQLATVLIVKIPPGLPFFGFLFAFEFWSWPCGSCPSCTI